MLSSLSTAFQQRSRFLDQEESAAQILLQSVRFLELKPAGYMQIFLPEERLLPFHS